MGNFIVGTVVISIIGLAVRKIYKDRKSGRGCGSCCENCSCHSGTIGVSV